MKTGAKASVPKVKATLVKSPISSIPNHVAVIKALGLRKLNQEKVYYDTPSVRGMLDKVRHLLRVERLEEAKPVRGARKPKAPPSVAEETAESQG